LLADWHPYVEKYFVPAQLALAMFGMGATLRVRDFIEVARNPLGIAIGLGLQLVLVPLIAFGFIEIFDLTPGWAVGLSLVSVVPGGAFSNLMTYFARGNVPLSISLTVAATAGCIITVPTVLGVMVSAYLPADFVFPIQRIVIEIGMYLILPLVLGMVVLRVWEGRAETFSKLGIRLSMLLIVLITISAMGSGRIKVPEYGFRPPALIVLFGLSLAVIVPHVVRLLGRYDDDTVAIGIEVTVRNVGIALLLIRFFFPGQPEQGHVLYTCLFYAGLSGFLAVPLLLLHRFGKPVVLLRRKYTRPELEPVPVHVDER
jgi:BASS family bile acid:Na+ symporter